MIDKTEGYDWREYKETMDALADLFKRSIITEDEYRKLLRENGFPLTDIDSEVNLNKPEK